METEQVVVEYIELGKQTCIHMRGERCATNYLAVAVVLNGVIFIRPVCIIHEFSLQNLKIFGVIPLHVNIGAPSWTRCMALDWKLALSDCQQLQLCV